MFWEKCPGFMMSGICGLEYLDPDKNGMLGFGGILAVVHDPTWWHGRPQMG